MQPMNYTLNTPDMGDSFQKGFDRQAGLMTSVADYQKAQAMATAAQQKAEADAQMRADLQEASTNPTSEKMRAMLTKYPTLHEGLGKVLSSQTEAEKESSAVLQHSVLSALRAKNQPAALAIIDQQIEASKNSGDSFGQKKAEMLRNTVIANPDQAMFWTDANLYVTLGPEKYAKAEKDRGENARAQELHPLKVEEQKLDNKIKSSASVVKELEAKFAPDMIRAELGLRKAQTNASNASAASSYASAAASKATAARANAEAKQINSGVIPADKRPEAETKFRDEYAKRTAGYQEVKQSYGRVLASNNDAAGDIALIFGYMKMLDPGSVVREGEFATAQNAAGVDTKLQNIYNKALKGERLTDGQRKMFKGQAENLFKSAAKQEEEVRSGIGRIATGYGLNTKNIFYTEAETAPKQPTAMPSGFRVLGVER